MQFVRALVTISCCGLSAGQAATKEYDLINRECGDVPHNTDEITRCLGLVTRGAVPKLWISSVYDRISHAYFLMKDYDSAISYRRLAIDSHPAPRPFLELAPQYRAIAISSHYAALSRQYEKLGQLQEIKALTTTGNTSRSYRESALASYSTAIGVWGDNHSALAKRAELLATLCKSSEAEADLRKAIAIAMRLNDDKALEKYHAISLPTC